MKTLLISLIFICFSFSITAQQLNQILNKKDFTNLVVELFINPPSTKNTENYVILADSINRTTLVGCDIIPRKTIFDYDFYGNEIEYINYINDCGTVYMTDKTVSSYDELQNLIQSISYDWDLIKEEWENRYDFEYFYNSSNNLTQFFQSNWNWSTQQWYLARQRFMLYDTDNYKIEEEEITFNTYTQQWNNNYIRNFTNDSEGNIIEILHYSWDNSSQNWVYKWKYDYIYLPNGQLEKIIMWNWSSTTQQWYVINTHEYFYNGLDQLIEWTYTAGVKKRHQYSYYSHGHVKQELISEWDYNINNWGGWLDRFVWYYSIHEVANISEENELLYQVYPNPATNFIIIKSEENTDRELTIFNVQGKQLKTRQINNQSQIDIRDFSEGIYFYQIQNTEAAESGKFIIKR